MPTANVTRPAHSPSPSRQAAWGWLRHFRKFLGGMQVESMNALLAAVDAKDSYTRAHSVTVAAYADAIAARMGLSGSARRTLQEAALLHDIGKIGIPDRILNKPGPLTDRESQIMRRHPQTAVEILNSMRGMEAHREIILHHHERHDGRGYPHRCEGEKIPLGARILSVADAMDTMLSRRSYKQAMSMRDVRRELAAQAGIQFDPQVVSVALGWIDEDGPQNCQPDDHLPERLLVRSGTDSSCKQSW